MKTMIRSLLPIRSFLLACGFAAAQLTGSAAEPFFSFGGGYTGSGKFAFLEGSKGTSTSPYYGCTNAACWGGTVVDSQTDCCVASNLNMTVLTAENANRTWKSLQFGVADDPSKYGNGYLYTYFREWQNPFRVTDDLIFVKGGIRFKYYNDSLIVAQRTTVRTTTKAPLLITNASTSQSATWGNVALDSPVTGASTCKISLSNTQQAENMADFTFGLKILNDWSGYAGELAVNSVTNLNGKDWSKTVLYVTNTTIGGSVMLGTGTWAQPLVAGEGFTINGELTLGDGSFLKIPVSADGMCQPITVGGLALPAEGTARIVVSDVPELEETVFLPLLRVPIGASVTKDDFTVVNDASCLTPCVEWEFVDDAGGETKTLRATYAGIVRQLVTDSAERTVERESSITDATHWSDTLVPHKGASYFLEGVKSENMILRLNDTADVTAEPTADYTFPGESINLNDYSGILSLVKTFGAKQITVNGSGVTLNSSVYGTTTWTAPVCLTAGSGANSLVYRNAQTVFAGAITGSGAWKLYGHNGGSTLTPGGSAFLTADNSGFTGKITVSITKSGSATEAYRATPQFDPEKKKFFTLYVKDGRSLGGTTSPADPKAVTIENMCRLAIQDATSVTIDEPTRGVFINWVGRFLVESGQTLTFGSPLAVCGKLHKEGAGRLVLRNPQPTFGASASATTPDADATNRMFVVNGGEVKVKSATALNGLDIVFADSSARLVLDADETDATMQTYGIVNTLTPGTAFGVDSDATDRISVCFDCATEPAWSETTLPICTVPADQAAAVKALLKSAHVKNAWNVRIAKILDPVDVTFGGVACKTIKARITRSMGLLFMVK